MAKGIVIDSTKEDLEKEKKNWSKATSVGKSVFTTGLMASFLAATTGAFDISAIAAVVAAIGLSVGLVSAKKESQRMKELDKMVKTEEASIENTDGKQK